MVFSKYGSCNCRVRPLALFLFNPTDRLPAINIRSHFESTDAARTALIAFADMRVISPWAFCAFLLCVAPFPLSH